MGASTAILVRGAATPKPPAAPRPYWANMCGIRVPGLKPIPGGAADPSLVLSWLLYRYDLESQTRIMAAWKQRKLTDVLLSWPDAREAGVTPAAFMGMCRLLQTNGFFVAVMGCSKDFDQPDVPWILASINSVLPLLVAAGVIDRFCIGWELSLWLSPTQVQELIDALAPGLVLEGVKVYVHFQAGYFAFQQPDHPTADFWNLNVGKLTGIMHQRDLDWDMPMYQARIVDCLERFAGQDGFNPDSGFRDPVTGDPLPFSFIALEITAVPQFAGDMDEATGNAWGDTAVATPPVQGPFGPVAVQGSGNGFSLGADLKTPNPKDGPP